MTAATSKTMKKVSMHSSLSERRSEPRSQIQFPILTSDNGEAMTRDVSRGGVFFYTQSPLAMGQTVEFKFLSPVQGGTSTSALCNGTVIRVEKGNGAAVHAIGVAVLITSIQL